MKRREKIFFKLNINLYRFFILTGIIILIYGFWIWVFSFKNQTVHINLEKEIIEKCVKDDQIFWKNIESQIIKHMKKREEIRGHS